MWVRCWSARTHLQAGLDRVDGVDERLRQRPGQGACQHVPRGGVQLQERASAPLLFLLLLLLRLGLRLGPPPSLLLMLLRMLLLAGGWPCCCYYALLPAGLLLAQSFPWVGWSTCQQAHCAIGHPRQHLQRCGRAVLLPLLPRLSQCHGGVLSRAHRLGCRYRRASEERAAACPLLLYECQEWAPRQAGAVWALCVGIQGRGLPGEEIRAGGKREIP